MSLVWHIVRKDFRRLRWPLILWLVLPLMHWTLLARASRSATDPAAFEGLTGFSGTWVGLTWAIGLILAAWLVMEDGLVSTRAFWRTRPVSGGRLLVAKVLGAVLMFGVLPVLAMTPIWLSAGFSVREWGLAALELSLKQGIFTVAAFAIAGVTENPGQFLVRLIGVTILVPLTLGYCAGVFDGGLGYDGDGLAESREKLVVGIFALIPLVMVTHQYLTRCRWRSHLLLGAGVALMLALRWGWQWDVTPFFRKFPATEATRNEEIKFTAEPVVLKQQPDQLAKLLLGGTVAGTPAGTYVRFVSGRAWWSDGPGHRPGAKILLEPEHPSERATSEAAGLPGWGGEPVAWNAFGIERDATLRSAREKSTRLAIAVSAALMRGRVVGELPLREGSILQSGASRTRITGSERVEGRLIVWVEERCAWPPWSWTARTQDSFLLSSPAVTPEPNYIPIMAERSTEFASMSFRQRQLSLAIPMHEVNGRFVEIPDWEESARLVKVTFSPESWFTKILPVDLPASAAP